MLRAHNMAGLDAHSSATLLEPSANRHRSACGRRILGRDSLDVSEQVDERSGEAPDRGSLDHVVGISAGIHAHALIYIYIDHTHLYGFPLASPPRPSSFLFSILGHLACGSRAPSLDTHTPFSREKESRRKWRRGVRLRCVREREQRRARGGPGGVYIVYKKILGCGAVGFILNKPLLSQHTHNYTKNKQE